MKNLNQIISSILTNQKSYQKAKERTKKAFDRALEWQTKKYERSQLKLGSNINFAKEKNAIAFGKMSNLPILCNHEHCLWWRKENVFKGFRASINEKAKKISKETEEGFDIYDLFS